ncbi:MAG TPA: hypothetical protein VNW52_05115 [Burkholderiaceae bacterium]|jgi:hypothetical protein|nr:hypothetical protein [Burkholderiaceae bacterium]
MQATFDFYMKHDAPEAELIPSAMAMTETFNSSLDIAEEPVPDTADAAGHTHEARLWIDDGWTARVIKNDDDDGWAVAMCKDGETEPALVGPWTMGRDKKNPKPLDAAAFGTLVKTASEVLRRHEQQLHAMLHKSVTVNTRAATFAVTLDIIPDEDDPYALLSAQDQDEGVQLAQVRVAPSYKLNRDTALAWVESGFRKPA